MYINHFMLESMLRQVDKNRIGMVSVATLEQVLASKDFNFPANAVDSVLIEMLGATNVTQIDRNCQIKIDTFMQSLRAQFLTKD